MKNEVSLANQVEREPSTPPGPSQQSALPGVDGPKTTHGGGSATGPRRRRRARTGRAFTVATAELAFV